MFDFDPHISDSPHRCQKYQIYFGESIIFTKSIKKQCKISDSDMFELDPHISDSPHRCQKCQFYLGESIMFTKIMEKTM